MCNSSEETTKEAATEQKSSNSNNSELVSEVASSEMNVSEVLKEIKLLQTKIAALEVAVAKGNDVTHMASLVQPFSGDDVTTVEKWIGDLENAFQALEFNDKQKIVAASSLLTGTAAVFLRTIRVSKYEDLKAELLKEFGSHLALEKVNEQLLKRRIRPEESVRRYVLEKIEMALNLAISDQDLVDIIIQGLNDTSHHVAMLYRARTLDELKGMLDGYERTRSSSKESSVVSYTAAKTTHQRLGY